MGNIKWLENRKINWFYIFAPITSYKQLCFSVITKRTSKKNYLWDIPQTLDDCSQIDKLISKADDYFTYHAKELHDFMELKE